MKNFLNLKESLNFKTNHIYLDLSEEVIVISDFLKENKQFISWSSMKGLMKKLKFPSLLPLPVYCYYDVAKILSRFLKYETRNRKKIVCLSEVPNELLALNMHVKIYQKMGYFIEIHLMNQYDVTIVEDTISCFLADFP